MSTEEVEEMIADGDLNDDGKMDFIEFCGMLSAKSSASMVPSRDVFRSCIRSLLGAFNIFKRGTKTSRVPREELMRIFKMMDPQLEVKDLESWIEEAHVYVVPDHLPEPGIDFEGYTTLIMLKTPRVERLRRIITGIWELFDRIDDSQGGGISHAELESALQSCRFEVNEFRIGELSDIVDMMARGGGWEGEIRLRPFLKVLLGVDESSGEPVGGEAWMLECPVPPPLKDWRRTYGRADYSLGNEPGLRGGIEEDEILKLLYSLPWRGHWERCGRREEPWSNTSAKQLAQRFSLVEIEEETILFAQEQSTGDLSADMRRYYIVISGEVEFYMYKEEDRKPIPAGMIQYRAWPNGRYQIGEVWASFSSVLIQGYETVFDAIELLNQGCLLSKRDEEIEKIRGRYNLMAQQLRLDIPTGGFASGGAHKLSEMELAEVEEVARVKREHGMWYKRADSAIKHAKPVAESAKRWHKQAEGCVSHDLEDPFFKPGLLQGAESLVAQYRRAYNWLEEIHQKQRYSLVMWRLSGCKPGDTIPDNAFMDALTNLKSMVKHAGNALDEALKRRAKVIQQQTNDFTKESVDAAPVMELCVGKIGPGGAFADCAVLPAEGKVKRPVTAIAKPGTCLLSLEKKHLQYATVVQEIDFLEDVSVFGWMASWDLVKVAGYLEYRVAYKGDVIAKQGEEADVVLILKSGEVLLTRHYNQVPHKIVPDFGILATGSSHMPAPSHGSVEIARLGGHDVVDETMTGEVIEIGKHGQEMLTKGDLWSLDVTCTAVKLEFYTLPRHVWLKYAHLNRRALPPGHIGRRRSQLRKALETSVTGDDSHTPALKSVTTAARHGSPVIIPKNTSSCRDLDQPVSPPSPLDPLVDGAYGPAKDEIIVQASEFRWKEEASRVGRGILPITETKRKLINWAYKRAANVDEEVIERSNAWVMPGGEYGERLSPPPNGTVRDISTSISWIDAPEKTPLSVRLRELRLEGLDEEKFGALSQSVEVGKNCGSNVVDGDKAVQEAEKAKYQDKQDGLKYVPAIKTTVLLDESNRQFGTHFPTEYYIHDDLVDGKELNQIMVNEDGFAYDSSRPSGYLNRYTTQLAHRAEQMEMEQAECLADREDDYLEDESEFRSEEEALDKVIHLTEEDNATIHESNLPINSHLEMDAVEKASRDIIRARTIIEGAIECEETRHKSIVTKLRSLLNAELGWPMRQKIKQLLHDHDAMQSTPHYQSKYDGSTNIAAWDTSSPNKETLHRNSWMQGGLPEPPVSKRDAILPVPPPQENVPVPPRRKPGFIRNETYQGRSSTCSKRVQSPGRMRVTVRPVAQAVAPKRQVYRIASSCDPFRLSDWNSDSLRPELVPAQNNGAVKRQRPQTAQARRPTRPPSTKPSRPSSAKARERIRLDKHGTVDTNNAKAQLEDSPKRRRPQTARSRSSKRGTVDAKNASAQIEDLPKRSRRPQTARSRISVR